MIISRDRVISYPDPDIFFVSRPELIGLPVPTMLIPDRNGDSVSSVHFPGEADNCQQVMAFT